MALTASIAVLEFESPKEGLPLKALHGLKQQKNKKIKLKKITYSGT